MADVTWHRSGFVLARNLLLIVATTPPAIVLICLSPFVAASGLVTGPAGRDRGAAGVLQTFLDAQRSAAGELLRRTVPRPERAGGGPVAARDLLWLAGNAVSGVGIIVLAYAWSEIWYTIGETFDSDPVTDVVLAVVVVPLVAAVMLAMALAIAYGHALVTESLLGRSSSLRQRLAQVTASRAATVDASATELRRIERDLHDGAQARLAAVGMTLGLAATFVRSDPERAEALLVEARADAGKALAELRDLVRGIHPPVLADRGLAGGLAAAALLCPIPVDVDIELAGRPQAPVESAMYFAATEAIANIGKHAQAGRAGITVRHADGMLRVTVVDDGVGGVDAARGTGVRGIERRLAAFDGRLTVASPPGGPTELTMELPCPLIPNPTASGSSSPRITSSSATA
jgi:signal transduction histidine kinase